MSEKKRILVVDDRRSDTQLVRLCLERTGDYVVEEVNDPTKAISVAEEFQPHLILMDLMMPDIDGGELAGCFQKNPKFNEVPIVFLTGQVTKEQIDLCNGRIGQYAFLAKPIVLSKLVACIGLHLRNK